MVSNSTMEAINYAKDLDIQFDMKLLILTVILIYMVFLVWWSTRIPNTKGWIVLTKFIVMRGFTIPYIVFYPFALMMLFRQVSIEGIFNIMLVYYNSLFITAVVIFYFFGLEWVLGFFGVKNLGEILTMKLGNRKL